VFLICEGDRRYRVAAYALNSGKKLWDTTVMQGVKLRSGRDPLPLAEVAGGVLFMSQRLSATDDRTLRPSVAAVRISDGKLLRYVGLSEVGGYNGVFSGKIGVGSAPGAGVIGLITRWGLIGISAVGPVDAP
jgi:hypothetical protein